MNLRPLTVLVLLASLGLAGCGLFGFGRGGDAPPERSVPMLSEPLPTGVRCFSSGDLYLSANLDTGDLEVLARRGVVTMLDLRVVDDTDPIRNRAQELGLRHVSLPVPTELPTDGQVDRVLAELSLERDGLVTLVCGTGSRSAIFFAIYCAVVDGADVELALEAARSAGMKPGEPEVFVRGQVERIVGDRRPQD